MHVESYGSGERAFFCIHGWAGDHREFVPLVRVLRDEARLLCVDLPGCGKSPPPGPEAPWTFDATADALEAAYREAGAPPCAAGFCSGAAFALELARRVPERLSRLILIDPFAFVPGYFRLFLNPVYGRIAYALTFSNPLGRFVTDRTLKKRQRTRQDFTAAFRSVDSSTALRYLRLLDEVDYRRFAGIPAVLDIARGEHTFGAVKRSVDLLRGQSPRGRTVVLPGAGHLPIAEGKEVLARFFLSRS